MLTQVTNNGNTYTYRYDALGSRVAKIVNSEETRYVGGLAETDSSGNITAYYVYGYGLISKITPSNQAYYYHFDGLGNTIAITDSSGNVVNKYSYDEHGKVLNQEEAISNPFKYVGRYGVMDEGNGLLYMRARYYDPEIGRFINKDPIGFAGGDLNLYAYVANDPINFIDPSGLVIDTIADIGFIIWDIYELITDRCNRGENLTALGLDVVGAFIPFATGLGKGFKVGKKALKFTADQDALIKLGKEAARKGATKDEAKILLEWAEEYGVKPALDHTTPPWHWRGPHIGIGPERHIPVK